MTNIPARGFEKTSSCPCCREMLISNRQQPVNALTHLVKCKMRQRPALGQNPNRITIMVARLSVFSIPRLIGIKPECHESKTVTSSSECVAQLIQPVTKSLQRCNNVFGRNGVGYWFGCSNVAINMGRRHNHTCLQPACYFICASL